MVEYNFHRSGHFLGFISNITLIFHHDVVCNVYLSIDYQLSIVYSSKNANEYKIFKKIEGCQQLGAPNRQQINLIKSVHANSNQTQK